MYFTKKQLANTGCFFVLYGEIEKKQSNYRSINLSIYRDFYNHHTPPKSYNSHDGKGVVHDDTIFNLIDL